MVEETVTVNPDGSTTFEGAEDAAGGAEEAFEETFEETMEEVIEAGIDPALYLLAGFIIAAVLYFLYLRKNRNDQDDYFSSYEKVSVMCWKKEKVIENEKAFSTSSRRKTRFSLLLIFQSQTLISLQTIFSLFSFSVQYQAPCRGRRILLNQRKMHESWMATWKATGR